MKIYYFANVRMPTEKAHGIQIIKTCQALVKQGFDLELIIPSRRNKIKEDIFSYYGLKNTFRIKKIFSLDLTFLETKLTFLIQAISFAKVAVFFALFKIKKTNLIYSRHFFFCWFLSFFKKGFFYEMHVVPHNLFLYRQVFKRAAGIIVITQKIKDILIDLKVDKDKILVAADGVDLSDFNTNLSSADCRQKINLPQDKKIILYTGHLFEWKGAQVLAEAARSLPDYLIVFVGGTEEDIEKFKSQNSQLDNILIAGHQPHQEINCWLRAADTLVLPNSGQYKISKYWTSPMKMFEYMAVKRPMVASDLPSIREVLNKSNAILVEPDKPEILAQEIKRIIDNPDLAKKIAQQAYSDVGQYSWDKRAQKIIEFINKSIPRT